MEVYLEGSVRFCAGINLKRAHEEVVVTCELLTGLCEPKCLG